MDKSPSPSRFDELIHTLRTRATCVGFSRSGEETASHKRAADAAEKELRELFTARSETQRWIPVTERLPDTNNAIMCLAWSAGSEDDPEGACVMEYDAEEKEWRSRTDTGCWEPGEITHWQPLPEAPK